jgi:hypothetical protein
VLLRLVLDMAGRGGGYGGWYQAWQVEEVAAMEVGIRHGRLRRWLWRLVSDMAGREGGYGVWCQTWQVEEVAMEAGIRHDR